MNRTEKAYELLNSGAIFHRSSDSCLWGDSSHQFTNAEMMQYEEMVNDGYTLWLDGGECPVDEGTYVDVVWRDWTVKDGCPAGHQGAAVEFTHYGTPWDIIAYRVVVEREEEALSCKPRFFGVDWAAGSDFSKVAHYTDQTGTDLIDDFARHRTPEQFRGAMMFILEKYIRRCGKKDDIVDEARKIADYANRWLEYEKRLK